MFSIALLSEIPYSLILFILVFFPLKFKQKFRPNTAFLAQGHIVGKSLKLLTSSLTSAQRWVEALEETTIWVLTTGFRVRLH